ncbi:MAG: hypothetical protein QXK88_03765 [Desulfurococcaceae archaeon]
MSDTKNELKLIKDRLERAFKKALEELEVLRSEVSDWLTPQKVMRLYRKLEHIVDYFEDALIETRRGVREIMEEAKKFNDMAVIDATRSLEEYMKTMIKEFQDKYGEVIKYIEEKYPEIKIKRRSTWSAITTLPWRLAEVVGKELEETVRFAINETRSALESLSTVISSIRLRDEDAMIIDELVEAGIFKSRSEAVAFFTRKGIEASKEWLEKIKENLSKIKELRNRIKEELERGPK